MINNFNVNVKLFLSREINGETWLDESPLLFPNQSFSLARADLTMLVFVLPKSQTWSVHAQTFLSFTWSRIVPSTYFTKSGYIAHTLLKWRTKSAYNSFVEEFIIEFHASIIFSTTTLVLTSFHFQIWLVSCQLHVLSYFSHFLLCVFTEKFGKQPIISYWRLLAGSTRESWT